MCRFTVYKGQPILLGEVVVKPENSLLHQARDAVYHPGVIDTDNQRNIIVNGDGFGLAWYSNDASRGSCCCKFITPAWSNANLRNLGEHIISPLIFAHVRAASSGHNPHEEEAVISNENCHPFKYGRWTFVHNGGIPHFKRMKRSIILHIKEEYFQDITGNTDSEYIFALFLSLLPNTRDAEATVPELVHAINVLISTILELCVATGIKEPSSLNVCITDGINIIATRFRNGEMPPSLYYKLGSNFRCENGILVCEEATTKVIPDGGIEIIDQGIVISSAPLSKDTCGDVRNCFESSVGWTLVPEGHMLICVGDRTNVSKVMNVTLKPIAARIGRGLVVQSHMDNVKGHHATVAPIQGEKPAASGAGAAAVGAQVNHAAAAFAKRRRLENLAVSILDASNTNGANSAPNSLNRSPVSSGILKDLKSFSDLASIADASKGNQIDNFLTLARPDVGLHTLKT